MVAWSKVSNAAERFKRHKACRALTVCRGVDIVQYFEHGSLSAVGFVCRPIELSEI